MTYGRFASYKRHVIDNLQVLTVNILSNKWPSSYNTHIAHMNSCISIGLIELSPCNFVFLNSSCLFSVCVLNVIFTPLLFTVNILSNKCTSSYNTHDMSFVIFHSVHMLDIRLLLIISYYFYLIFLCTLIYVHIFFLVCKFFVRAHSIPDYGDRPKYVAPFTL